jgi:hypothetical protein
MILNDSGQLPLAEDAIKNFRQLMVGNSATVLYNAILLTFLFFHMFDHSDMQLFLPDDISPQG